MPHWRLSLIATLVVLVLTNAHTVGDWMQSDADSQLPAGWGGAGVDQQGPTGLDGDLIETEIPQDAGQEMTAGEWLRQHMPDSADDDADAPELWQQPNDFLW